MLPSTFSACSLQLFSACSLQLFVRGTIASYVLIVLVDMGNLFSHASQSTQSASTNSTVKELTINDLALLCDTLNPVASKCRALGLQLGVKKANIDIILKNYKDDCQSQLCEIISERLKQDKPLTRRDIVTTLKSPTVGESSLASQIEQGLLLQPIGSRSPVRGPSEKGSQSPVREPSDRGSRSPVRRPSDRGSQSPVRGPSDEGSRSPVRGPSDGGSRSSVRGPSNRGHYSSRSALRGPSDGEYDQFQQPVSEPSGSRHYTSHSIEWEPANMDDWGSPNMNPPQQTAHPKKPCTSRPYPPTSRMSASTTRSLQERVVGGQCDSQSYMSHSQPQTSNTQSQRNSSMESSPGHNPPYSLQPLDSGTGNTPHMCFSHQMPQYQTGHPLQLGGQWDSQLYTSHGTNHTQSQKRQSEILGLGSSPPPAKRPHLEPQPHHVRPNIEPPSNYRQSQTSGSGLGSPLAKITGVKSPMDQYIDYVKDTYRQSVIENHPSVLKWPLTPEVFISLAFTDGRTIVRNEEADEYTRSIIEDGNIDGILNQKTEIDFSNIAKSLPGTNSSEKVILVEGAPGMGKSTFAWEFCRRWQRGEIAQQYQLVLLLRLRDHRIRSANDLQDLIYHPNTDVSHAVQCELVDSRGVSTLIILEGFNELPDSQRKEPSIFLQLILGKLLLHAVIMVTSQPWATGKIMRTVEHRIFQHIEVLGFTEKNIMKYICSVFTGESKKTASAIDQSVGDPDKVSEETKKNIEDVMAYLNAYPQIKVCMYIPLNAAIVVSVYQDSKKGKCILPKTLTELYYALTQKLLLHYLYGHVDYKEQEWSIDSFEKDLPDKVYRQLLTICKVAYDGICTKGREQLVFSDNDLSGYETLGFMQSVAEVYVKHGRKSHNFLHLRVQEFLAALFIYTQSLAEQLKHFQRHKQGRLRVVLRFLSGLTKLNKVSADQLRSLLGESTAEQNYEHQTLHYNPMRPDVCVSAHHTNWLFEAQNSELLQSLFHNHTASFTFTRGMLPLEYYSVGYCIARSHSKWSLTFDENPEEEKVRMLLKGAETEIFQEFRIAVRTKKSMSSKNLNLLLTSFGYCVEGLYLRVMTRLSLPHLSVLRILELSLGGKSDVCNFSLPVLESLKVIGTTQNSINPNTKKALCKLLSSSRSIVHFHFQSKVSDRSMEEIVQSLCHNTALELKSLEIKSDYCGFTTTATECVCRLISKSTALEYLKIHISTIANIFAQSFGNNVALPLKSVDIDSKCTFTTIATKSLVQFITKSTTLQYIGICHVTFSAQGLIELTEAIHHCSGLQTKLEKLTFFVECSEDVVNLRHSISDMQKIIDWRKVVAIHLSSIEDNKMTVSTLNLAFEYGHIKSLDLRSKNICDARVEALFKALYHSSTLEWLDLSNNSISDSGVEAVAQALHQNSTLKELDLSDNSAIGKEGTHRLIEALTENTSITKGERWHLGGLRLPWRCKEFATECTQYNTVKDRIHFVYPITNLMC